VTTRIFVSQTLVDVWMTAGHVELDRDLLRVPLTGGHRVDLFINPAVYFDRVDGSDPDENDVIGRVKTTQELAQLGAEHYETAVLLGDFAYTVKPGFVAAPVDPKGQETALDATTWGSLLAVLDGLPGRG
jgi:hypothetical protein